MNNHASPFRAGLIAIVGAPNVGKSTFLNRVLGRKLVITSSKPQTTRDKIAGILTDEQSQIVFLDTPGLVTPRDLLHEALSARIHEALDGADAALLLRDALRLPIRDDPAAELLSRCRKPVVEAWNKVDALDPQSQRRLELDLSARPPGTAFAISALTGEGIPELLESLRRAVPEGPPLYPPDDLSDRDLRFLAAELVREKVFDLTREEIPYAVATRTDEYVERPNGKHFIRVLIYVEQESQKGILIGRGGALLKQIGQAARPEIEDLADHPVYLELAVKVRKNWTKRPGDLKHFGYRLPKKAHRPGGKHNVPASPANEAPS